MAIETLKQALKAFADIDEVDFELSSGSWRMKEYKKGEYYNEYKSVCRYLGFVTSGVFRSFVYDEKSGERNIFLYCPNQFVVTFKSFIYQIPCDYHTQAATDATVIYIDIIDLLQLTKLLTNGKSLAGTWRRRHLM